ncbi:MAG: RecQ family ATP-dependent DNA helicase [Chlorobi bacterium]|nr:RecQ family ATP-dependent DNA helicase [Chlorobiota bacterium]
MDNEMLKILKQYWGFSSFRPLQKEIIEAILHGNDTLALLPTGGGKSICFQVPAMMREGTCLVITPLIALMNDQIQNLKKLGIRAVAINSGMHSIEIDATYSNCLHGDVKFLYVSPERLENNTFQQVISKMKVSIIVIDEAHCISQWGYDFRPPYLRISEIRNIVKEAPYLALTATATPLVVEDIVSKLKFRQGRIFKASFERKNLAYRIFKENDKTGRLIRMLREEKGSAIVYVRNRKKTREIAEILKKNGVKSVFYHAGMDPKSRKNIQKDWTLNRAQVIVATNAFGMGIDKPDVRQVIHYDLPNCMESYFQEAGRAGRDGKPAVASLIFNNQDVVSAKRRLAESYPPLERIRNIYNALGNFYQIPEGSGKDVSFDFDIVEFSNHYEFNLMEVFSSLNFLEKEGFIYYNPSGGHYSKLLIQSSKEELYRYMVENPGSDRLLKELMRSYAGLFTDYVNINENQLAKRAEIDKTEVIKKLTYLDKIKLISYIPVKTKPQLVYVTERLNVANVLLSQENYRIQKEAAESRLQSFLDFINNPMECRSQQLLAYFAEKQTKRCGICDVCLARNKTDLNKIQFDKINDQIRNMLSGGPKHLYELTSAIREYPEEDIIAVVRWLLDHKRIIRNKDETLQWYEQLDMSF